VAVHSQSSPLQVSPLAHEHVALVAMVVGTSEGAGPSAVAV